MLERIGKFEVKEKIGEGGMGVVYKAYDPLMHRHVAIKTFTAELEVEAEVRSRFLREAIAVGRLTHANIVTVHDVFEEGGGTYMVMEYLEGQSLGRALRTATLKSLADKLWVMEEVCKGLTFAHSMGVVHRDIKPANIFLTTRGEVKILDFGIARIASTTVSKSTTKIMGTPYYMSPEQWSGGNVDHRADIFSLGVMLYEMLAGRRPFESHNPQAVAFQVINSEPTPIQELNTTVPNELAEIVARSLAKKPDDRFRDVQEIQDELHEINDALSDHHLDLAFEETQSLDATPQVRPTTRSGRTPRSRTSSLSRSRSGRDQPDPGKRWLWAGLAVTTAIAATAGWFLLNQERPSAVDHATTSVTTTASVVDEAVSLDDPGPPPPSPPVVPTTVQPSTSTAAAITTRAAQPTTGTLVVRSTPGASIVVDARWEPRQRGCCSNPERTAFACRATG